MNNIKLPEVNDLWIYKEYFQDDFSYCFILKTYGDYISYLELNIYGILSIKHRVDKYAFIKHSNFIENRKMSIYDLFGIKEGEYDKNHSMIEEKLEKNNA